MLSTAYADAQPVDFVALQSGKTVVEKEEDNCPSQTSKIGLDVGTVDGNHEPLTSFQPNTKHLLQWHKLHTTEEGFDLPATKEPATRMRSNSSLDSLKSFTRRLSYTSSQREDIMSVSKNSSSSSTSAKESKKLIPTLGTTGELDSPEGHWGNRASPNLSPSPFT